MKSKKICEIGDEEQENEEEEHSLDEEDVESRKGSDSEDDYDSESSIEIHSSDDDYDNQHFNEQSQAQKGFMNKLESNLENVLMIIPVFSDDFIRNLLLWNHVKYTDGNPLL